MIQEEKINSKSLPRWVLPVTSLAGIGLAAYYINSKKKSTKSKNKLTSQSMMDLKDNGCRDESNK